MSDYDSEGNFIGKLEEQTKKKRKVKRKGGGVNFGTPAVPLEVLEAGVLPSEMRVGDDSPFCQMARGEGREGLVLNEVNIEEAMDVAAEAKKAEKIGEERQRAINDELKQQMRRYAAENLPDREEKSSPAAQQESLEHLKELQEWADAYGKPSTSTNTAAAAPAPKPKKESKTAAERYEEWRDLDWTERVNPRHAVGKNSESKSFQNKEKRKRDQGLQGMSANFIEEEKRILRQAGYMGGL